MTVEVPESDTYDDVDVVEVHSTNEDEPGIYDVVGVVNPGQKDEAVVCAGKVDLILINGTVSPIVNGEDDGNIPPLVFDEVSLETNLMVSIKSRKVADIWVGDNLDD